MKLTINNLAIAIENDLPSAYLQAAAEKMRCSTDALSLYKILSKSLDLRNQNQFYFTISVVVTIDSTYSNKAGFLEYNEPHLPKPAIHQNKQNRPIIVGFGPAGMFAALTFIDNGYQPRIFERGKAIEERCKDVKKFIQERILDPESNIQFGEGGAGSFSDGKLFSRRNKNTSVVNRVLQMFVKFGAPPEIEYISKPHLGTDLIRKIVKNIRSYIIKGGGTIHYNSKMTDILIKNKVVSGIRINSEQEVLTSSLFLAVGHSSRDTYSLLEKKGVALTQRKISVGVRIEHPVEIINKMRYGDKYFGFPQLGAATYSINHTDRAKKRGVYTFCMCPGGEIVNASSEPDRLVLNGMSYSDRALPYSNGALVVSCHVSDYGSESCLAGIAFQKSIEEKAFSTGKKQWKAPAQRLVHFLGESSQNNLLNTSYQMGLVASDLHDIFPQIITQQLHIAFSQWKTALPLFVSEHAMLLAPETRTSSPVRIVRDENFESITTKNLFPIGEGAGYTGGITSSAADGIKAVECYLKQ